MSFMARAGPEPDREVAIVHPARQRSGYTLTARLRVGGVCVWFVVVGGVSSPLSLQRDRIEIDLPDEGPERRGHAAGRGRGFPTARAARGRLRVAVIFTVAGGPRANSFRRQRASRGRTAFRF